MNIKNFYPSITEETLDAAIVFPQTNTNISNDDIRIIKHSRNYLLFNNTKAWKNKCKSCFDITMGSPDGVEVSELVEIFILSHLTKIINQNDVKLARDDGSVVIKNLNDPQKDSNFSCQIQ